MAGSPILGVTFRGNRLNFIDVEKKSILHEQLIVPDPSSECKQLLMAMKIIHFHHKTITGSTGKLKVIYSPFAPIETSKSLGGEKGKLSNRSMIITHVKT